MWKLENGAQLTLKLECGEWTRKEVSRATRKVCNVRVLWLGSRRREHKTSLLWLWKRKMEQDANVLWV